MATTRTVFLDDDDVLDHITAAKAANPNAKLYNALTTICVGKKGANYILKNFKIHVELLENVFDTAEYKTLGITTANSEFFDLDIPGAAAPATRVTGAGYEGVEKGVTGKSFSGRKVKIPVSTAMAAGLTEYFPKAGVVKLRKFINVVFPHIATVPQIGTWIYTHLATAKKADVPFFIMPSGTRYYVRPVPDTAALDKFVGEFAAGTAAKLDASGEVVEFTP